MRKSRRATITWLFLIALLLGVVLISGAVSAQVQLLMVVGYVLMARLALGFFTSPEVRSRLPELPRRQTRAASPPPRRSRVEVSSAAKRAQERAGALSSGYGSQFQLVDVGLIASDVSADGLRLRRSEFSLDDQGLQPYLVLNADSTWANERITVRFEILDHSGEVCFARDEEVYLRTGANNVLSAYRLPLRGESDGRPGLWEMRALVNGEVIGLHTFSMGPSLLERQRLIAEETEAIRRRQRRLQETLPEAEDDSPISLEELLRGRQ
jgi:hypothetical protein